MMRPSFGLSVALSLWQIGVCVLWTTMNTPQQQADLPIMIAALKLHSPDQPDNSLMGVFKAHMEPELQVKGQAKTARSYETAIRKFTDFLAVGMITNSNHATANQSQILTDDAVLKWQQHELAQGIAASSINTHSKYLRAVLRRMGPREKGNPRGLGIIATVPHVPTLAVPKARVKVVDIDVLDTIYTYGCPDVTWPPISDGISACKRWRCWLVCAYNLAMRTRDLFGLRWDSIHWEPQSLDPDSTNESPYGWIEWVPAKTKRKKPEPLVLPLHQVVRAHLESIRCEGEYVFGRQMAKVSDRKLYGQEDRPGEWYKLLDLSAHHRSIPRFEIRAIRRTANSQYNRVDRKLGSHVLGHSPRGVNDLFYQQWEKDAIELMAKLPQPASFTKSPGDSPRQIMMF